MYALIIVDYNSLEQTVAYIRRYVRSVENEASSHIVVVENGTVENAVELLSASFGHPEIQYCDAVKKTICCFWCDGQQIVYCDAGENLGYAKGNNLGTIIADTLWNDPFYIISNNDIEFNGKVDLSVASRLFAENPEIGVIGPRVVLPSGEQQSPRFWQSPFRRLIANYWILGFSSFLGKKHQKCIGDKYCNDTAKDAVNGYCDWVSGCFMIVRADSFRAAGLFDEYTFLYAEEMILSKRLENTGSRMYFCPDLMVVHNHAETTKKFIAALRMLEIDFNANYYFYKTYMHSSVALLSIAKVSFFIYLLLIKVKHTVKHFFLRRG